MRVIAGVHEQRVRASGPRRMHRRADNDDEWREVSLGTVGQHQDGEATKGKACLECHDPHSPKL